MTRQEGGEYQMIRCHFKTNGEALESAARGVITMHIRDAPGPAFLPRVRLMNRRYLMRANPA
jgi:hypothetical protein